MPNEDAGFFLELSELLQSRSAAQIRSEAKGYAQLRALFPGKSMSQIVTLVRTWHKKERLSAPVLADRVSAQISGASDEPREVLLDDLGGIPKATATALLKALGFAPAANVQSARDSLVSYVRSGGEQRPPSLEEQARQAAMPFIERAKPALNQVDVAAADLLRGTADDVYAIKGTQSKHVFAAFARALGCEVKGGKAQMRKTFWRYVDDLARLYEQSRS